MTSSSQFPPARISLEYFPPRSIPTERALMTAAHALRRFGPAFQTVTLGANASDTEDQKEWPARLQELTQVPTAAHLPLSRFSGRDALLEHAERLWQAGIKRLVVIRGDGEGSIAGFTSVAHAVRHLKDLHEFTIAVSAYPEVHPKAASAAADIDVLLAKQDSGADAAITQFFFDNDDFYRFRDKAERAGFFRDIIPGVMPITRPQKIFDFAESCGAQVPADMKAAFSKCGDDNAAATEVARNFVTRQVADLANAGVDDLHIYTMNRIDLAADTIRAFYAAHESRPDSDLYRMAG